MTDEQLAESLDLGPHYELARLAGHWEGSTRVWFEPGVLGDESPMRGSIRLVLGGRFALHEYEGALGGKSLQGLAIYGYHVKRNRFEMAWIDSFHMGTAIMLATGGGNGPFLALGQYEAPHGGLQWGWRTDIELLNEDALVITAWNVSPQGEKARAVETRYFRSRAPTPAR